MNPIEYLKINKKYLFLIISILIALSFLVVYITESIIPKKFYQSRTIDLGSKRVNQNEDFYILEDNSLSPNIVYGKKTYRETRNSPFYLVYDNKDLSKFNSTLEIYLYNRDSNLYLNDILIFPGLDNYELVKEFDDSYLYKRRDLSTIKEDIIGDNLTEFITNNYYGSKIFTFSGIENIYKNTDDYKDTRVSFNNTFRGNLKIFFYTINKIDIKFIKEDLNQYIGEDNYTVIISDLIGNVVYNENFKDDGILEIESKKVEQKINISVNGLNGAYYIDFLNIGENKNTDSTIKNLEIIGTNKAVIKGNFLILDPANFYIKNENSKNISFYYWHSNKNQIIEINNSKNSQLDNINLDESYKGLRYELPLSPGEHYIKISKGYLWVINDFYFSHNSHLLCHILQDAIN